MPRETKGYPRKEGSLLLNCYFVKPIVEASTRTQSLEELFHNQPVETQFKKTRLEQYDMLLGIEPVNELLNIYIVPAICANAQFLKEFHD